MRPEPNNPGTPGAHSAWAIDAQGLTRRFGCVEALTDVSLQVRPGEFFSLLGPSGCGKTTLLRIIAGLEVVDAGTLHLGGVNVADIPAHRRPVNTVFQSYALFPHLTVRDNVAFGLRMRNVPRPEITRRVDAALVLVQIPELATRHPAQLSGGQKQRVALARALVNEPAVLLLDEPLGALDLKLRRQLQVELHQLQQRLGITFIHVTHDQDEALVMSDRIAVMNAGRIQQVGSPEELYERPRNRFVAQFLGSCNLLEAEVVVVNGDVFTARTSLGVLRVKRDGDTTRQPGQKLTLAVRPEKIRVARQDEAPCDNSVSTQIAEVIYCGAETHYRLRSGAQTLSAVALNRYVGHQGFDAHETVQCQLPEGALVVLDD